jgi:hypothetical protein
VPPLDRANPRPPEPDEASGAIEGLSDNEVVRRPLRDTLRGYDELHCRWAPWDDGRGRGWIACTDPYTGETHLVASKYVPVPEGGLPPWLDPRYVPDDVVAEPAPPTFVWRAMDAKDREKNRRLREQAGRTEGDW